MRVFYAIEFDEAVKDMLIKAQQEIKGRALRANFTRRENLHLTLRFMGEVDAAYLPVLQKIQDFVAEKSPSFQLRLSDPGVFVKGHKSVVWWGVFKDKALMALQKTLEEEIRSNGFPWEVRPYKPHITLARELVSNENMKDILKGLTSLPSQFEVRSISLMESTRVEGKLTYICRYRSAL